MNGTDTDSRPARAPHGGGRLTPEWISGLILPEDRLFLLLAVVIGVFSGLLVVCFRILIDWARVGLLGSSLSPSWPRVVLVPVVAGLLIGLVLKWVFPRVRGSGVNQTKAALYIYDGYIPFNTVVGKFLTCALAIGSGQSLGPEDPSLQIGAGLASVLGRALRLSRDKVRLIAPIGAAAGLAAAFNAPISAVLFVIEEVIGNWSAGVLGAVVMAAVSSVVVTRWFLGSTPLFVAPPYQLVHPQELLAYVALGVLGGLAALAFVKLIVSLRTRVRQLPAATTILQPAVAGLIVGIIGIWLPQVMGAGYESIDQAMHDQYPWMLLVVLALAKIVATTISFVGGAPGGLFAPTLFIGAMVGSAVGMFLGEQAPGLAAPAGVYGLVGMGAFFAAVLRAPMTSVFMIMEVSGSYSIILPVMISNAIAYLISLRFQPTPIFDVLTRQDGLDLPSMEEQRESKTLRVEDAMRPAPAQMIGADDPVEAALARTEPGERDVLVLRGPGEWSVIAVSDLQRLIGEGRAAQRLGDADGAGPVPRLHPDQPLEAALTLIAGHRLLPVVHRADPTRLEGIVALGDILNAYRQRRAADGTESHEG